MHSSSIRSSRSSERGDNIVDNNKPDAAFKINESFCRLESPPALLYPGPLKQHRKRSFTNLTGKEKGGGKEGASMEGRIVLMAI